MTQSLKDLRKRLRDLAKAFQYEPETTKAKFRDFYRLTKESLELAEALTKELDALKNPKLPMEPPKPYVPPSSLPKPYIPSRAERLRDILRTGEDSNETRLALKWMKLTWDEARKIVDDAGLHL